MYFLERETPTTVWTANGKQEPVETFRRKQVAISEDLDALKRFYDANISVRFKALYRYWIISNVPGFEPVRM